MNTYKKWYINYTLLLLAIFQLVACSMPQKQIEIWDISSVKRIAIIPPTTGNFNEKSKIVGGVTEQSLYGYVGKIAKDIILESGKFVIVEDSKDADAILDCEIISFLRNSQHYQDADEHSFNVIYSIFLKRTIDGVIIGDRAGTGFASYRSPTGPGYNIGGAGPQSNYKDLINMDRLREVLGIATQRRQEF